MERRSALSEAVGLGADDGGVFPTAPRAVLLCAFLQFGAAVPLGIFTAAIVSRLHFLGVRAAGATIALYGGLAASLATTCGALVMWVLARPGIADDVQLTRALYYLISGRKGRDILCRSRF
jgi:hypothetical protein